MNLRPLAPHASALAKLRYTQVKNENGTSDKLFESMNIEAGWKKALEEELKKPYMRQLSAFVQQERGQGSVYPPAEQVFAAFTETPFSRVKAVVVGQDPYHGAGQAHGLCFSVQKGVRPPPSLKNIFKELESDVGAVVPAHGCLQRWAEEGVLMLNALLTVREGSPMSHAGRGWEQFTDAVIRVLAEREDPLVFLLWGKAAKEKCDAVLKDRPQHLILTAPHPSPYSAHSGFFGCRHFSKANEFLQSRGKPPIVWAL